jgi:hypothetical protein
LRGARNESHRKINGRPVACLSHHCDAEEEAHIMGRQQQPNRSQPQKNKDQQKQAPGTQERTQSEDFLDEEEEDDAE